MEETLVNIWNLTVRQFNTGLKLFSSEKSFVFWFAWNLKSENPNLVEKIDFERSLFKSFSNGTFLDLYLELKIEGKIQRVGIEFKFPHNKGGYTNQTQTRQKCINDLKRLNWLVENQKIDLGLFLMVTDEAPYINKGKYKVAPEFRTSHGTKYKRGQLLPTNENLSEQVKVLIDQEFEWNNYNRQNNKISIPKNQVAWINPIKIKSTIA